MIIVLKPDAPAETAEAISEQIASLGLEPLCMPGSERVVLGALGDERVLASLHLEAHPHVERVQPILAPYKLASRELRPADSVVTIGEGASALHVGGERLAVIAGPCAVESAEQIEQAAALVKAAGGHALRGGAFKPRTSPYAFQGMGQEGLELLAKAGAGVGLPTVTEVVEVADVERVAESADAFQVGARNMQNYRLLQALGEQGKPVVLKRGMAATVDELLSAAEYILAGGNPNVIVCERGIKTFETGTRNTLDISAVPRIKAASHLPVLIDPSHAAGERTLVPSLSLAAVAAGADGLLIEVHPYPERALCDGRQSLSGEAFAALMRRIGEVAAAVGRTL